MHTFFAAQLGDGSLVQYWIDNWSTHGILSEAFLHLFALSTNPTAKVEKYWDCTWKPTLAGTLSNQRVKEFMIMQ